MENKTTAAKRAKAPQSVQAYLEKIESLTRRVIESSGFDLAVSVRENPSPPGGADFETQDYILDLSGPDADLLLERNAELLNAVEYVVLKAVRLDEELFGRITFDCEDWRRLRAEELKLMAQVAAERVMETGKCFPLGPMSPRERRIVHLALRDHPRVHTASEGAGSDRKVVIMPSGVAGTSGPSQPAPKPHG